MRTETSFKVLIGSGFVTLGALLVSAGWLMVNAPRATRTVRAAQPVVFASAIAPAPATQPAPETPKARFSFLWSAPEPPPLRTAYSDLIHAAAAKHAVSPKLVAAVMRVESDFDPLVVSHKGARGLMQVMPATGERFGVKRDELFVPQRNIAAGTAYLAWLLRRYNDVDLALAAYNAGEGAVDRYRGIPPYRETREYVRRVRAALRSAS
jgi:soluble lytic murein transglycosylase-like protein